MSNTDDVTPAPAGTPTDLRWGVKESLRNYIGSLSDGVVAAADGATLQEDGIFRFPWDEHASNYDPATGRGVLAFTGTAQLSGHFGMLSVTLTDPRIEIGDDGATLTVVDVDEAPNTPDARTVFASVHMAAAEPGASADGIRAWDGAGTKLSTTGADWFMQYSIGQDFDPIRFGF